MILAHARMFGYVFNPLTVFWCHRADGTLACAVAEVHNTYRQRHAYLLHPDDRGRARAPKRFHVSPFYPVDGGYRMFLPEPGLHGRPGPRSESLTLSVTLTRPGGPFVRGHRARHRPAGHRAGPARRRRAAPLVHGGRVGPDPVAGDQAVPARAARRTPATSPAPGGSPVSSGTQQAPSPWP